MINDRKNNKGNLNRNINDNLYMNDKIRNI